MASPPASPARQSPPCIEREAGGSPPSPSLRLATGESHQQRRHGLTPPPATSSTGIPRAVSRSRNASSISSSAAVVAAMKTAPPRRMSTRLQLTLRERLHGSRRFSAHHMRSELAEDEDEGGRDGAERHKNDEVGDGGDGDGSMGPSTRNGASSTGSGDSRRSVQEADTTASARRERKRKRRLRRIFLSLVGACRAWYYLLTVPLRVGLFFDPFFTAKYNVWTTALTVFMCLDVVSDANGLVMLLHKKRQTQQEKEKKKKKMNEDQDDVEVGDVAGVVDDEGRTNDDSDRDHAVAWRRANLVMDIVAYAPLEIILLATAQYNALHLVRVTKLLTLRFIPAAIKSFILISRSGHVPWRVLRRVLGRLLLSLVVIGIVWTHWSALIYAFIAHVECGFDLNRTHDCVSWAADDQLRRVADGGGGGSKFRVYSRAIYWASRTIITLGFSDVVANPTRSMETTFTIVTEFAGAFWCACVIAAFAYWFSLEHRRGSKYTHDLFVHRVAVLLRRPQFHCDAGGANGSSGGEEEQQVVPEFLRRQILDYLKREYAQTHSFREEQCRAIVRQEQLQQGLQCELKTARLLKLPCFSRQSLGFLNALAGEMALRSLAPLDWVIEYPGTQSLFFVVVSGSVAIVSPANNHEKVSTCSAGDGFGAITLFDASMLKEKAFAEEYAEILVLNAKGFERGLKSYYHAKQTTAMEQRQEMHHAAQEDYAAFVDRCKRHHESRVSLDPLMLPATAQSTPPVLSHWDTLQSAMELDPRQWTNATSLFRVTWEAVRCVALLYLTFEVPYVVVFYFGGNHSSSFHDEHFTFTFACSALVELFFYSDLYLRCQWFQPRKNMRSVTFYLDTIANLPLALVVDVLDGCSRGPLPLGWQWLSLLRLVRLLRVRRLKKRVIATLPRATGVAQFIIFCAISILVYCHAVACLWFLTGHQSQDSSSFQVSVSPSLPSKPECLRMAQQYGNCSWTVMDNMEPLYVDGDRRFVFLRSLYFSISTFTTVAYGDILPFSNAETWIAAIATYIGGTLCYAMFGAMGAAIARLARRRRETRYDNHLRACVLEMHNISRRVRSEINRFQTFRSKTLTEHHLERQLLDRLSLGLRGELSKCFHVHQAQRFAFLQHATHAFRDAVAARMTRRFYFKGDTIFTAGDVAPMAMVIRRGRVQLVDGESELVVTVLTDGSTLGERSFVTQSDPLLVDYMAEVVTEVSVLSYDALQELWTHFPDERRRMLGEDDVDDGSESADPQSRRYIPMSSSTVYDPSHALSRILIRQDSRGKGVDSVQFEQRVAWQRAINGNTFRSRWELLVGSVVVYNTFSIIARVAFTPAPSTPTMVTLTSMDYVFDLALLGDIYLKCCHFLAPADLLSVSTRIFTPKQIRTHYRREGWMLFDVAASLPLYYIGHDYALMTYCRLPRLLRALQLVEIGEHVHSGLLQRWTASSSSAGVAYSLLGLGKVLVVLLLCCHIGGSLFYAVSAQESPSSGRTPWLTTDVVTTQHLGDLWVAYLRALYWALSSFTVVNYGDIVATTVRETLWACLICLFGTFCMSKVVSDLVDLLQSLDQCVTAHRERVETFEYVAQRRDLPEEITERGQLFLNYEYEVSQGLPPPEAVLGILPRELQAQVYDEMYGSILRRVPLFESLTDMQIRELAAAPWRTELFLPQDLIVYESSLADALFVMKQGRAEVVRFASDLIITQIQSGQLFGEAMFFTPDHQDPTTSGSNSEGGATTTTSGGGPRRMVSVRALSFCEVLRLDRDAWLRFMAMRTSNREAGKRVLAIAQGEQLKSRAVLQTLESYLSIDDHEDGSADGDGYGDHRISRRLSSRLSDRVLDSFDNNAAITSKPFVPSRGRDVRVVSAPVTVNQSSAAAVAAGQAIRRIGSTPAALFSRLVHQTRIDPSTRRTSAVDAYVETATPTLPDKDRLASPRLEQQPRRAMSHVTIHQRFGVERPASLDANEYGDGPEQAGDLTSHAVVAPSSSSSYSQRFLDSSTFCYRWDAVKFFAILYYVVALPLRVSFYDDIERAASAANSGQNSHVMTLWIALEYAFVDGFFWLDIVLRLFVFTPTVRGEPLTCAKERRKWYLHHGGFLIDFLGSFPFEIVALLPVDAFHRSAETSEIVAAAIRLSTLVRCFQLEPLWWRLERQLYWFQKDTLTMVKIVFIGVLSSHWVACLWYFVGHATMGLYTLSWLTAPNMLALSASGDPLTASQVERVSMLNKYLRSYHYAIGSISTTTYGDITSRNVGETFAQLGVTFLCLVFYGYVTSGVRQILSRKFDRTIALEQEDANFYRFARHYKLSRSLRSAIRSHVRERWRQESDVDQHTVSHLLHAPLRREIASFLRRSLFEGDAYDDEPRKSAFDGLPDVVVETILVELREEAYVEGEVIYEQYAVGRSMYFVESGRVLLTTLQRDPLSPSNKCEKQQGEYFGESAVVDRAMHGSERRATAIARTQCRLVVLDVDAYERVLERFPTYATVIRETWTSSSAAQPMSYAV